MKKYLLLLPILAISAFILMGIDAAHAQSSVYSAGDLIKTADRSTVYYFGFDGKRHIFPNEPTYFSWYSNFDGIKIVTEEELASITLGHNIVIRPGTNLVKIESDSKVYAVEPYGILRHIPSEQTARNLYGYFWADKVLDVNVAFFPDYLIREPLPSIPNVHPEGTVFRYLGDNTTYIYRNDVATPFRDLAQAEAHRYQERFILTLAHPGEHNAEDGRIYAALAGYDSDSADFDYTVGDEEISEINPVLIDVAQTLVEDIDEEISSESKEDSGETVINNYYSYYPGGCASCPACETCNNCEECSCDSCEEECDEEEEDEEEEEEEGGEDEEEEPQVDGPLPHILTFKVGSRVRYTGGYPKNEHNDLFSENLALNTYGTIIIIETPHTILYGDRLCLIKFDQNIGSYQSEGDISQGYGVWIPIVYLELVIEEHQLADGPLPNITQRPSDGPLPLIK